MQFNKELLFKVLFKPKPYFKLPFVFIFPISSYRHIYLIYDNLKLVFINTDEVGFSEEETQIINFEY